MNIESRTSTFFKFYEIIAKNREFYKRNVTVAEVVYEQEMDLSRLFMESLGEPVLIGCASKKGSGSFVRNL